MGWGGGEPRASGGEGYKKEPLDDGGISVGPQYVGTTTTPLNRLCRYPGVRALGERWVYLLKTSCPK